MTETEYENLVEEREKLPIWPHRDELVRSILQYPCCVVVSSTGTGKTTQLPHFLLDAGFANSGMIAVTQPRRLAAMSVAHRVAAEVGRGKVGEGPVGYSVRFDDASTCHTRLRFLTDGLLLRESALDPMLRRYAVVILDEAHERTLNSEVLLGVVKKAMVFRELTARPLRLVVMSATIDPRPFVEFLGAAKTRVIYVEGRQHPIKILNVQQPSTDYVSDAASACIQLHTKCPVNHGFLIFLTGEEEISRCVGLIRRLHKALVDSKARSNILSNGKPGTPVVAPMGVFPLFAALPHPQQARALEFAQPGTRKVIVSTNIAETSLTIPGIRYVIDSGRAKTLEWDSRTGLERLAVSWVSQSQAWQRAGRAGREGPGVCVRLFTEAQYRTRMPLHPASQLASAPLDGVLLHLLAMNIQSFHLFPWLEPPKPEAVERGLELLLRLGAVSKASESLAVPHLANGHDSLRTNDDKIPPPLQLTKLGRLMSAFPLSPRQARALCSAARHGCLVEGVIVVSMLYVSPVFYVPQENKEQFNEVSAQFRHADGDLATLVQVYRAYRKANPPACSSASANATVRRAAAAVSVKVSAQRVRWCREHFLNPSRMRTAVKVRTQLRDLVKSAGLGPLSSCGSEDFSPLIKAFFEVAYRDQVAILTRRLADRPSTSNSSHSKSQSSPFYELLAPPSFSNGGNDVQPSVPLLCIHPDSCLHSLAVLSKCPPLALLFLELVDSNSASSEEFTESNQTRRILMRHISVLPSSWLTDHETMRLLVGDENPDERIQPSKAAASCTIGLGKLLKPCTENNFTAEGSLGLQCLAGLKKQNKVTASFVSGQVQSTSLTNGSVISTEPENGVAKSFRNSQENDEATASASDVNSDEARGENPHTLGHEKPQKPVLSCDTGGLEALNNSVEASGMLNTNDRSLKRRLRNKRKREKAKRRRLADAGFIATPGGDCDLN